MTRICTTFVGWTSVAAFVIACEVAFANAGEPIGRLTIENSDCSKSFSLTRIDLPESWTSSRIHARDADGNPVPVQVDETRSAWLRIDGLSPSEKRVIELFEGDSTTIFDGVSAHRVGNKIEFWSGKKRVMDYQAEPGEFPREGIDAAYRRGGYIHPVWSPNAVQVTDDFPKNHVHHHGIWFPWTKTKFEGREPDFWNMGAKSGRVEFVQLDQYSSGSVFGQLRVQHRFVDLLVEGGKTALNEKWTLRVFAVPKDSPVWIFDLESVQTCATDAPLFLPKYRYGGLGFRGHWDWNGKDNAFFLTSTGETDRVKGHATRADWCYIGGDSDGRRTGIVVMCHPDNFRFPQPMRLHPTEPFFCYAPQLAGDMSIQPGMPYISKYRFLVIDGEPDADAINRYWSDYAKPVSISVSADNHQ